MSLSSKEKFVKLRESESPELRAEIVKDFTGLAEFLARRFSGRGEEILDLTQVALMGLVKAVDRFDPQREVEFSTYATHTITGELKRHFRDKGWAIRAPRRIQELYLKLGRETSKLTQTLGRAPTTKEIAEALEVSEEDILEALEAGSSYSLGSLDQPIGEEGETVSDTLSSSEDEFAVIEQRSELTGLLDKLDKRSQRVLILRFFAGKTQSEIAADLGVSQMHVSRIITKALRDLKS